MDTNMEDKMVHQIEKNLSNHMNDNLFINMNDNLFSSGRVFEKDKKTRGSSTLLESPNASNESEVFEQNNANESFEYISQAPTLSRAEYIREAREACLRQLSNQSNRAYETYSPEQEGQTSIYPNKKKTKTGLFHEGDKVLGRSWVGNSLQEENTPQEIASFRSLIIRTVCAIVLFLSIFAIDKFKVEIGNFTHEVVREYITGNDRFMELENMVVSWLK